MTKFGQKSILFFLSLSPVFAMAHPGHDQTHSGFSAGFTHPFTGLDHMMMAVALGVLFYSAAKKWNAIGMISMVLALAVGFIIGAPHWIPEAFAEYGIVASLMVVAIALWSKSNMILPVATAMLVTFHGVAHGAELGGAGHVVGLVAGMVVAMSLLYAVGLLLGKVIADYIPHGKKIVGFFAAIVALIGLA